MVTSCPLSFDTRLLYSLLSQIPFSGALLSLNKFSNAFVTLSLGEINYQYSVNTSITARTNWSPSFHLENSRMPLLWASDLVDTKIVEVEQRGPISLLAVTDVFTSIREG